MTETSRLTRRTAAVALAGLVAAPAWAKPNGASKNDTFSEDEIVTAVAGFFGTTARAAAEAVERIFRDHGRPTAYVAGEEVAGAIGVGLRYGDGTLFLKSGPRRKVFWQGPSIGFDTGGNASKVFTLAYNLRDPDLIFRRYPGVEGSAYFVGGIGVNYLRADDITLAPMRAGVGFRAGANVGYLAFSRKRRVVPL
ncbi:MAG: DUF1134 domain-containing protein [Alphaproteobacteria bacterium]|nr:DUF1134 domain-containing protein [Alphaproteobacteria bacterium]